MSSQRFVQPRFAIGDRGDEPVFTQVGGLQVLDAQRDECAALLFQTLDERPTELDTLVVELENLRERCIHLDLD